MNMNGLDIDVNVNDNEEDNHDRVVPISPRKKTLTTQELELGFDQLGKSANGTQLVFLKLNVSNRNLASIDAVRDFIHLQNIDVSNNALTTLAALSSLTHLTRLNASHNRLTVALDFHYTSTTSSLTDVDLSNNRIVDLLSPEFATHRFIKKLALSHNRLSHLQGIESLKGLIELDVSNNRICEASSLGDLPITLLNISQNQLHTLHDLSQLKCVSSLDISQNHISSLEGISTHRNLLSLDISTNEISSVRDVTFHLNGLPLLRDLVVRDNPFGDLPVPSEGEGEGKGEGEGECLPVWKVILHNLPDLVTLDGDFLTVTVKIAAHNALCPPEQSVEYKRSHGLNLQANFKYAK